MAYTKPDVTVLQEFRNLSPSILTATLQSCIVGPATFSLQDEAVATYDQIAIDTPLSDLLPNGGVGLTAIPGSFSVSITDYAGVHPVQNAVVRCESGTGTYVLVDGTLTDDHAHWNDIVYDEQAFAEGTTTTRPIMLKEDLVVNSVTIAVAGSILPAGTLLAGDIVAAGDMLHIIAGTDSAVAPLVHHEPGYYSNYLLITDVDDDGNGNINELTVTPPTTLPPTDLTDVYYVVTTPGFIINASHLLKLPPDLLSAGPVTFSGSWARTDYAGDSTRLIAANSITDLETVFGAGNIVPANPLAFGMYKALATLGPNDVVLGVMVESDNALGYAKAFEYLESQEVYCIVPLTNDATVHQLCQAHCDTMSAEAEKHERICIINTGRFSKVVKAGYFGVKDADGQGFTRASGTLSVQGTATPDESQFSSLSIPLDGTGVAIEEAFADSPTRLAIRCRADPTTLTIKYKERVISTGIPDATWAHTVLTGVTATDYTKGITPKDFFAVLTPSSALNDFYAIQVTSTVLSNLPVNVYAIQHISAPTSAVRGYAFLSTSGTQMFDAYYSELFGGSPDLSDYKSMKIRHFNRLNTESGSSYNYATGLLPSGMVLDVSCSDSVTRFVNFAGPFPVPNGANITGIRVHNSVDTADIDDHLIEFTIWTQDYPASLSKFTDTEAHFRSAGVTVGDELVIYEGPGVAYDADGVLKRYRIATVVSETVLTVGEPLSVGGSGNFYRIERGTTPTKDELATWYAGISQGYGDRRVMHLYLPVVGVAGDAGELIPVEGYYVACAVAGMTQSAAPQNGFTNRPIPGFMQCFYTNDYFSERQMDIIAGGGTAIVIQPSPLAPLCLRHQLTTDMTSVQTQEYSVTKNLDHMAKTARITFRPYIGRFLINNVTLTTLYSVGNALCSQWLNEGQILSGTVDRFMQDATRRDRVVACFNLDLPIPLNNIRLIFVI